jgi:hypothetical protein
MGRSNIEKCKSLEQQRQQSPLYYDRNTARTIRESGFKFEWIPAVGILEKLALKFEGEFGQVNPVEI